MNIKFYTLIFTGLLLTCLLHTSFAQIPQDGLVGYYMLDGNAADSSGMANDGTIVDQVNPTVNRFGEIDKACSFEGGYIDVGNPAAFQMTDAISIAAWVNLTTIDVWAGIVTKWSAVDGGLYLGINPDGQILRWNIAGVESTNGEPLIIGEWVHIVATFDGDSIKTYQNGILTSSTLNDTPISNNGQNLFIGTQSNILTSSFNGAIDDVLIYDRGLSQEEVDLIFIAPMTDTDDLFFDRSVDLSPNPTNSILKINNNSEDQIISYALYNAAGMKLRTCLLYTSPSPRDRG